MMTTTKMFFFVLLTLSQFTTLLGFEGVVSVGRHQAITTAASSERWNHLSPYHHHQKQQQQPVGPLFSSSQYDQQQIQQQDENVMYVRSYLQQYYPIWLSILDLNDEVWKSMVDTSADGGGIGYTLFVLSDSTLRQKLTETQQEQLFDPRNLETAQKIAAYHVIGEVVTGEQLYNAGGVLTVGGEVPIERSRKGGFFGFGGQEDGTVTINQSQVIQTDIQVGTGLIHEVDSLISPSILWRYMDQLRIPGSK